MNKTDKMPYLLGAYILTRGMKTLKTFREKKKTFSNIYALIVQISFGLVLIEVLPLTLFFFFLTREAQEFVEKYEGALGKGKGKRLYAYRMLVAKVGGREAAIPQEGLFTL